MLIGIDFDNTIVCYDELFYRLAAERGWIPRELGADKNSIRDYLRREDREDDWTFLQGIAYGSRINEATAFAGVKEFFEQCCRRRIPVCVISHKTRFPYRGPRYDLHEAARGWLRSHDFLGDSAIGLSEDRILLEETKQAKLARIASSGCTHFIDDLPEFLLEPDFPADVCRILFDPAERHPASAKFLRFTRWEDLDDRLFSQEEE